jgi:hydrogenase nickel incorporation protein HypA/HybF
MHEMSLLRDLLARIDSVAKEQGCRRVLKVRVKLGALAHISPEHFREHFEIASPGTAAEGAELEVELLEDINDPNAQGIILDSLELPAK